MNTTTTPKPDYGEPWRKETYNTPMGETGDYEGHLEIWAGERRVADCWNPDDENEEDFDRIVTCVNACAGMADPAVEIAAMREERDNLRKMLESALSDNVLKNHGSQIAQRDMAAMRDAIREAQAVLQRLSDYMSDSNGISGYHRNGDIVDWDEAELRDPTADALAKLQPFTTP